MDAVFSWSSGKDSALALYRLLKSASFNITALVTTLSEYDRVGFHAVRRMLLEEQARSIGIPLTTAVIPACEGLDEYKAHLQQYLRPIVESGIKQIVYGDIFLEELKRYRLALLAHIGMQGVFPLWQEDSAALIREFIDLGFKAVVTCVDSNALPLEFLGQTIDHSFLARLPEHVDPCGENGEFHTFTYAGPIFRWPIAFSVGETVFRDGFSYCDLLPVDGTDHEQTTNKTVLSM